MSTAILTPARAAYYDRNATTMWKVFDVSYTSPHASTVRWTQTVANGTKSIIEHGYVDIYRITAATTAGQVAAVIRLTTSSALANLLCCVTATNTLNIQTAQSMAYGSVLYAGDVLTAITVDASTGGEMAYRLVIKGTTFDV